MKKESCILYERYENTPSVTAQKFYYFPQWSGHFVCNPDFYIERCNWPDILILLTTAGNGKLIYREKEYILDKNTFAIINCMDKCTYFPISEENWAFSFLHFTGLQSTELYEHIYNLNDSCVFNTTQKIEKRGMNQKIFAKTIDKNAQKCYNSQGPYLKGITMPI